MVIFQIAFGSQLQVLLDIGFPASIEVLSAHADQIRVHIPWAKLLGQSTSTWASVSAALPRRFLFSEMEIPRDFGCGKTGGADFDVVKPWLVMISCFSLKMEDLAAKENQ